MWKPGSGRIYEMKGWNAMDERQKPCLTAPEILGYLGGELTAGQRAEIDRHLEECRLCGAAVEGVAGLEWREGFLRSTESVLARVRSRTATAVTAARAAHRPGSRARSAPQYLTLAATLVLGVGAALYLTRPGPDKVLFEQYFEPYPSLQPVVRGASNDGRSNALALYEVHDYRGALAALEDSLKHEPNDPVARFYAGLSRLALGQTREATLDLEMSAALSPGALGQPPGAIRNREQLQEPVEWYLALAHLRGHDLEGARSRLGHIAQTPGFYQDKARALLSELDRLDHGK